MKRLSRSSCRYLGASPKPLFARERPSSSATPRNKACFLDTVPPPVTNARAQGGANYAAEGLRREPPRRLLKKKCALPRKSSWRGRALEGVFFQYFSALGRSVANVSRRSGENTILLRLPRPKLEDVSSRSALFLLKPRSLEDSPLPSGALRRGWGYLRATSARPRLSRPQRRPRRENARRLEPKRVFPV